MKASVELCINKLPDAATKSELKANCKKFNSELGSFQRRMVWLTRVCQVACRVARWPVFHRSGRYFTANLAEAGKRPVY